MTFIKRRGMVMALRTFQIAFSMGFQKWILSNFLLKQFVKKQCAGTLLSRTDLYKLTAF